MPLIRIQNALDSLPDELRIAAQWILQYPEDACFLSMREQAKRAHVLPPTMSRLAKVLNYESFPVLQQELRRHISWKDANYAEHAQHLQTQSSETPIFRLQELQQNNLATLAHLNSNETIGKIAQLLIKAPHTLFLGSRSTFSLTFYAYHLHHLLLKGGTLISEAHGMSLDILGDYEAPSVCLCFSLAPYLTWTLKLAKQAADQGLTLICITDSLHSPIAKLSHEKLLFQASSNSFFHSLVGAYSLIEQLMTQVSISGGPEILTRLQEREIMLKTHGIYKSAKPI